MWQAVEGCWLPAEKLLVGDWVHDADGEYLRVSAIAVVQRLETVHNLEVEGLHTFFVATEAGGDDAVLVHNVGGCGPVNKGKRGVDAYVDKMKLDGGTVIAREITVDVLVNGKVVRIRPDLLIRDASGVYRFIEVKNGGGLTKNQKLVDDAIRAGDSLIGTVRGSKLDPKNTEHDGFFRANRGGVVQGFIFEVVEMEVP